MSTFNPYAQQGWNNQPNSTSGSRPSMYGALPFPGPPTGSLPTFFAFRFTSFSPTILNCIVVGPQPEARPYYRVLTDAPMPGVSVFQNTSGTNVALVQWHRHPEVEIRGSVSRKRTSEMLALTQDRSARAMTVNNAGMTFTPQDNFIWVRLHFSWCNETTLTSVLPQIHSAAPEPELLGRISRGRESVTLELTGEAIHRGMLESAVVATFLLQCGRNID
ncbi:hypothetical protein MKEN_00619100 [Mycena kentingensis (nom. inval.)]|nr:hypothetical protein MKEN_00619100 [Mycena kentingensis (nom. inval.)]